MTGYERVWFRQSCHPTCHLRQILVTLSVILKSWADEKNDPRWILLRIQCDGQRRYLAIGEKARPTHWLRLKGRANHKHPEQKRINDEIEACLKKARDAKTDLVKRNHPVTADAIRQALRTAHVSSDFFAFSDSWLKEKRKNQQIYYFKKCQSVCRKFEEFAKRPLAWTNLTPELLRRFDTFMLNEKKNSPNTRNGALRVLRTITRQAVMDAVIDPNGDPFYRFRMPKKEETAIVILTDREIEQLEALVLRPGTWLCTARDLFLLSYLSRGTRYGDLARLKQNNIQEGRLAYRMHKSKTIITVPITDRIQSVLDRYPTEEPGDYVFPILKGKKIRDEAQAVSTISSANSLVNRSLKTLAAMAGISKAPSMHVARHSWACRAKEIGVSPTHIQDGLGHGLLSTTTRYLAKMDTASLDSALEEVTK